MASWAIRDAEAHLDHLVEEAQTAGPQVISKEGTPRAVILSFDEYNLLSKRQPTLVEVLLSGPKLDDDDPFFAALERDRNDTGRPPRSVSQPGGYLLDTNVISEPSKRRPNESVLNFIDRTPPKLLYISVLTLGELRRGAKRKEPDATELTHSNRHHRAKICTPITRQIAQLWGELSAPRSLPVIDTLLAATALTHNLTLVTRNTYDVADTSVKLLNPWL